MADPRLIHADPGGGNTKLPPRAAMEHSSAESSTADPGEPVQGAKRRKIETISPAKRWCFTWNNYPEDWETFLEAAKSKLSDWIVGQEVGSECQTPHLQGYIEFSKKDRPMSALKWPKEIHWELAKYDRAHNVKYCSKDGKYVCSPACKPPRPLKLITELNEWQQDVVNLVEQEPDDRTIHWFWEPVGGVGKSALCKLLCAKYGAIICAGKAADMKHQISEVCKNGSPPTVVIFDVPRSNQQYISYTGIEEIKNGCFASSKYESGMVVMNCPHVFVFANDEPDRQAMSADRWDIRRIQA